MITLSLVGAGTPPLVQIVLSETPAGASWVLTGVADGYAWTVPGGMGVGDGEQLVLVDNRAPLNTPIEYTLTWDASHETSSAIVVPMAVGDMVIQSLDGQKSVAVALMDGTQALTLDPALSLFSVPGRRMPVSRYSATSAPRGTIIARADVSQTADIDEILATGEAVLCRLNGPAFELPLVQTVHLTNASAVGYLVGMFRHWEWPYVPVDDPFMDQRLGAFSWNTFDDAMAGRSWDEFDTVMSGLDWDAFDTFDWTTL